MRRVEFMRVLPRRVKREGGGVRYFDGPRALLAVGSCPRDGIVTPTHFAHTQPTGLPGSRTPNPEVPFLEFRWPGLVPGGPPRNTLARTDLLSPHRHGTPSCREQPKLRCLTAFRSSHHFRIDKPSQRTSRPRRRLTHPIKPSLSVCWIGDRYWVGQDKPRAYRATAPRNERLIRFPDRG
jgi:hypothetical protein